MEPNQQPNIKFSPLYSGGSLYLVNHAVPVILDIEGMEEQDGPLPCYFQHDPQQPVGTVTLTKSTAENGLPRVEGEGEFLTGKEGAWAFEVRRLAQAGYKWEGSIKTNRPGFGDVEVVQPGVPVTVNGRNFSGPCKIFRHWRPIEASFVFYGADPYNNIEVTANGQASHFIITESIMPEEVREYIASLGVDPNEVTPEQATAYERCYKAQQAAATAEGEKEKCGCAEGEMAEEEKPACAEGEEEKPACAEGEMAEEEEKPAAAEGEMDEKLAAYIKSVGGDPTTATPEEIQIYAACFKAASGEAAASGGFRSRPNPAIHLKKGTTVNVNRRPDMNKVMALAMAETYTPGVHKAAAASGQFSQAVVNEALAAKNRGLTLGELMAMGYEQKYNSRIRLKKPAGYAQACLHMLNSVEASGAFSTINPLTILQNAMNIQYLDGFETFTGIGDKLCDVNYNDNLQTVDYTYYDVKGPLELIAEGAEIPHVTLADAKFTTQVYTWAQLITLTEDAIINDRFDAFMKTPRKMGRIAAAMREYEIFKTLCDNLGTLCTSAHGNTMTTALSVAGLDTATQKLGEMETVGSTSGVPMFTYLEGKYLVVPNALATTARTLYTGASVGNLINLDPDKHLTTDPWAGRYEPMASPYFGSRGCGGDNGDTHWALLADPSESAALMLTYLSGEEKPKIEEFPTPPNILGKTWRCCYRFGVAPADYRAIVYSTGAGE